MEGNSHLIFQLTEKVIQNGYDLRYFFKELIQYFRNLLLVKSVQNPQELLFWEEEDIKNLKKEAELASSDDLLRYLSALQDREQGLKFSSHPRIYLETLLVKLCHYKKIVPLKKIIKELDSLKKEMKGSSPQGKFSPQAHSSTEEEDRRDKRSVSQEKRNQDPNKDSAERFQDIKKTKPQSSHRNKEMDEALKDPTVKSFMDTFKAQIISVKETNKRENQ